MRILDLFENKAHVSKTPKATDNTSIVFTIYF
jgi:hypothetical protein